MRVHGYRFLTQKTTGNSRFEGPKLASLGGIGPGTVNSKQKQAQASKSKQKQAQASKSKQKQGKASKSKEKQAQASKKEAKASRKEANGSKN